MKTPALGRHRSDGSTRSTGDIIVGQRPFGDERNLGGRPVATHYRRMILAGSPPFNPMDIRYWCRGLYPAGGSNR
ncbi:hypothetical protein FZI91_00505 [Mycobacterium sp. CBMA271]|nr:hypothetical protein [Mycobacteroides sp. CBMA 271]